MDGFWKLFIGRADPQPGKEIAMKLSIALAVLVVSIAMASPAFAHCEIPCGIYDDEMRLNMIAEHITTIEKSINEIERLSKEEPRNFNQIVRWVQNKEDHANELQHIVSQYFMTQRLKPVDKGETEAYAAYMEKLVLLHQMLTYSMKAKQTTDKVNVDKLRSLLSEFRAAYMETHKH